MGGGRGATALPARGATEGKWLGEGEGGDGAGGEGELAFAVRAAELARDAKFLAGDVDEAGEAAAVARAPKRAHCRR